MSTPVPSSANPKPRQNPPNSVVVTVIAQALNILAAAFVFARGDISGLWGVIGAILILLLGRIILSVQPNHPEHNGPLVTWLAINNLYMFFTAMKYNLFQSPDFDPGQGGGEAFTLLMLSFCFMGPLVLGLYFQTIRLLIGLFRLRQYGIWLWLSLILILAPPLSILIFLVSVAFS
jgi:hypothetical protein